jgi:hypothetical protein
VESWSLIWRKVVLEGELIQQPVRQVSRGRHKGSIPNYPITSIILDGRLSRVDVLFSTRTTPELLGFYDRRRSTGGILTISMPRSKTVLAKTDAVARPSIATYAASSTFNLHRDIRLMRKMVYSGLSEVCQSRAPWQDLPARGETISVPPLHISN